VDGPLGSAPADAAAVQRAAEAAGVPVPGPVREAYETADAQDEYAALATLLPRAAEVVGAVGAAADVAATDRDPVADLGARALGIEGAAADARTALAAGRLDDAAARADAVTDRVRWAPWAGLAVVFLVLALLAGAAVAAVRARRRRVPTPDHDQWW
jgi:cell wall assembly regulator SMI1